MVYGTWAALGIASIATIDVIAFNEHVDVAGVIGILLIIAGVICLNIISGMATH